MSAEREVVLAVGILHELHASHPRRVQDLWRGRVFDRYRDLAARMRAARGAAPALGAALALDVARMLRQLDELNAAAGLRQVLLAEEEEEEEDDYALVIIPREAADDVD